jgi:hypothetical protein
LWEVLLSIVAYDLSPRLEFSQQKTVFTEISRNSDSFMSKISLEWFHSDIEVVWGSVELVSNVSETASVTFIGVWCDEYHIQMLYTE